MDLVAVVCFTGAGHQVICVATLDNNIKELVRKLTKKEGN